MCVCGMQWVGLFYQSQFCYIHTYIHQFGGILIASVNMLVMIMTRPAWAMELKTLHHGEVSVSDYSNFLNG